MRVNAQFSCFLPFYNHSRIVAPTKAESNSYQNSKKFRKCISDTYVFGNDALTTGGGTILKLQTAAEKRLKGDRAPSRCAENS